MGGGICSPRGEERLMVQHQSTSEGGNKETAELRDPVNRCAQFRRRYLQPMSREKERAKSASPQNQDRRALFLSMLDGCSFDFLRRLLYCGSFPVSSFLRCVDSAGQNLGKALSLLGLFTRLFNSQLPATFGPQRFLSPVWVLILLS